MEGCETIECDPFKRQSLSKAVSVLIVNCLGVTNVDIDIDRDTAKILENYEQSKRDNSLLVKYPELAKEWCYEKNGVLSPDKVSWGYGKRVWWKCSKCGNVFPMTPNARTKKKSGCPECSKKIVFDFNKVQIRNDDTGEIFNSLTDAALSVNGRKGDICEVCKGRQKTAFGYHWSYVNPQNLRTTHYNGMVLCVEENIVFENDKVAAKWCHGDNRNINSVCNGRKKTYHGYHWEYIDD